MVSQASRLTLGGVLTVLVGIAVLIVMSREPEPGIWPVDTAASNDAVHVPRADHGARVAIRPDGNKTAVPEKEQTKSDGAAEGHVSVHVETSDGRPVRGASVTVTGPKGGAQYTADDAGFLRVRLEADGPHVFEAIRGELYGARRRVSKGQSITIKMASHRMVQCQVLDQGGTVVRDAVVRILAGRRIVAGGKTDAQGMTAVLRLPDGALTAMVDSTESKRSLHPSGDAVPSIWSLTIERLPHLLTGVVMFDGARLEGAKVWCVGGRRGLRAVTGEDGSFTLGRHGQGDRPTLVVQHRETAVALRSVLIRDRNEEVLIELEAGRRSVVTVTDDAGRPVESARVAVNWVVGRGRRGMPAITVPLTKEGVTSAKGECELIGLPSGSYRVTVKHPGFNDAELEADEDRVRVRLSSQHDWLWQVVLAEDVERLVGVEGWTMTLTSKAAGARFFGKSDRKGRFVFRGLPPGKYGAQVEAPDDRWREFFDLQVEGSEGKFSGPSVVVRAAADALTGSGVVVRGQGYKSTLRRGDGEWIGLCRAGKVRAETKGLVKSQEFVVPRAQTEFVLGFSRGGVRR